MATQRHEPGGLDGDAFAELYRVHYAALRLVAVAEGGRDEADDVVQRAALVAMERLDRFEPGTNFRAWMAAIVRGVARNHRRGRSRRERRHREAAGLRPEAGHVGEGASGRSPRVFRTERAVHVDIPATFGDRLRSAVESLGPQQAACLLLRVVHEHTYDEIAVMLGVPVATARSHVFRARAKLLDLLGPAEDDDV